MSRVEQTNDKETGMTDRKTHRSTESEEPFVRVSNRTTIPASEVGVTLTLSKEALAKLERIQEENIKAVQASHRFFWR